MAIHVPEIGFYNMREKMTDEQLQFAESILNNVATFSNSGAGTGKTTIALASMKYLYDLGEIDRIVYIVSPVEERTMGHRPGDMKDKEADYLGALYDALIAIGEMPEKALDEDYGFITAKSDTFMRGVNLKRVGVIVEEAQNYNIHQLKKVLTRIHDDCHVAIIGHDGQIDFKNKKDSGFVRAIEHFKEAKDLGILKIDFVNLTKDFRGDFCKWADKL